MNEKIAFVSGCDANYYPMLREWIHSVQQFPLAPNIDICIMNTGLTKEQEGELKALGHIVVTPDWPANIPPHKTRGREYLKSCVCRPFIPDIFPGYDLYMWMDADTWIQDWRAIELYLEGARRQKLTITAQTDRGYFKQIRVKWFAGLPIKIRGFYFSNALKAFGLKTAQKLLPYHVLNAGSFAMAGNAPHWKRWQELLLIALKHGKVFTAEQLTLGVLTYLEDYPVEILPAWTQWLCENKPLWNAERAAFVENFLPQETIGIVHISGYDHMRTDRTITTTLTDTKEQEFEGSFRYPYFNGETLTEITKKQAQAS